MSSITPSLGYSRRSTKKTIKNNLSTEEAFWGAGSVCILTGVVVTRILFIRKNHPYVLLRRMSCYSFMKRKSKTEEPEPQHPLPWPLATGASDSKSHCRRAAQAQRPEPGVLRRAPRPRRGSQGNRTPLAASPEGPGTSEGPELGLLNRSRGARLERDRGWPSAEGSDSALFVLARASRGHSAGTTPRPGCGHKLLLGHTPGDSL